MKNKLKNLAFVVMALATAAIVLDSCSDSGVSVKSPQPAADAKPIVYIGGGSTGRTGARARIAATECTVTNITANRTLDKDTIYVLLGDVRVNNGAELTIEAGTVIKGDKDSRGTLSIERGSRIIAAGTATAPIVFTSSAPVGSRQSKDWGGVNIFGNAPNNQSVNQTPEGYPTCVTPPQYGGTDCSDDSGVLTYVRIEFGGIPSSIPNSEKNGLTMYSVGNGTIIHHVQVSFGGDDSFEWFGGCVNAHHLISFRTQDDDFDTDFGYQGSVIYGIAVRDPRRADNSTSNGFESDNNAAGDSKTPFTSATFSNFTLVGPYNPANTNNVVNNADSIHGDGLHLRRNTALKIYNTVVAGFRQNGVRDNSVNAGLTLHYNVSAAPTFNGIAVCYTEVAPPAWTGGINNVCRDAATATSSSTDNNGLIRQSGLQNAAWTLNNPNVSPLPSSTGGLGGVYTSPLLAVGKRADTITTYFSSSPTEIPNNTTSNTDLTHYFIGARRASADGDNGWNFSGSWYNFDPQNVPYSGVDIVEIPEE